MKMQKLSLVVLLVICAVASSSELRLRCPEPTAGSPMAVYNMAWLCDLFKWRESIADFKKRFENECNVTDVETQWEEMYQCPDFSNITCMHESSLGNRTDSFNCSIIFCKDGHYEDEDALPGIWRQQFHFHRTVMNFSDSINCTRECPTTETPVEAPSCAKLGKCCTGTDDLCLVSSNGTTCHCDENCIHNQDCCSDYELICKGDTSTQVYEDTTTTEDVVGTTIVYSEAAGANCDFEAGLCLWEQDSTDTFDWTRHTGGTPSPSTGPSGDHTTSSGYYLYIEATSQQEGDTARLISPKLAVGQYCLKMWYHMYGRAMGSLLVRQITRASSTLLVEISGDQGTNWLYLEFDIDSSAVSLPDDYIQIVIEGVDGTSFSGDLAIDDITVTDSLCEMSTQAYEDTTTTAADEEATTAVLPEACRGGTYISGDLYGTISSPNYPFNYTNNAQCSWYISVPDGMVVTVQPGWSYDIEASDTCIYDYLQLNYGQKICGLNSYYSSYQTTVNYLTVIFYSDGGGTRSGFSFDWIASSPPSTTVAEVEDATDLAEEADTTTVAEAQTTAAGSGSTDSTAAVVEEISTEHGDYGNAATNDYSDYSQTNDQSTPPDAETTANYDDYGVTDYN